MTRWAASCKSRYPQESKPCQESDQQHLDVHHLHGAFMLQGIRSLQSKFIILDAGWRVPMMLCLSDIAEPARGA